MRLTIGIKALNEEAHIAAAIESALAAAAPFDGEVVLADSGSTDRTIEIARAFPIRIVQLANAADRCCGAGAQLAFQHASGDFFFLLDGDMVLRPDFVPKCLQYLLAHGEVAAVGGLVRERNTESQEFKIRAAAATRTAHLQPGYVDRLDGGGLYRVRAVQEVGWFADRNLRAFEELELGARLAARGWKLARIDETAIDHFGHQTEGYSLMWRRLNSGYLGAPGEVLRSAIGTRHLSFVIRRLSHIRVAAGVSFWWLLLLVTFVMGAHLFLAALMVGPLFFLSLRRGSIRLGLYSLVSWNFVAVGAFKGFFRHRTSPKSPLTARILREPNEAVKVSRT